MNRNEIHPWRGRDAAKYRQQQRDTIARFMPPKVEPLDQREMQDAIQVVLPNYRPEFHEYS